MRKTFTILTIALLSLICSCSTKSHEEPVTGLANPWKNVEAETILSKTGYCASLPDGATEVSYRWNETAALAQVDFTMDGLRWTARIQKSKEFCDISGMYYQWIEENSISESEGRTLTVKTAYSKMNGQDCNVICILQHDRKTGLMKCLSCVAEKDGLQESARAAFNALFN